MTHTLKLLAKVVALVAILFVNPLVIGAVYAGFVVFHFASKRIVNKFDRLISMFVAAITVSLILPIVLECTFNIFASVAFAALLTWVFTPDDKDIPEEPIVDQSPITEPSDEIIEAEVISVTTIEH